MQPDPVLTLQAADSGYEPPDRGEELTTRGLQSVDELAAIGGNWRRLWLSSPDAMPFQSPDWLIPWCRAYSDGRLLLCWAMRA
jgi:hypothetical protein